MDETQPNGPATSPPPPPWKTWPVLGALGGAVSGAISHAWEGGWPLGGAILGAGGGLAWGLFVAAVQDWGARRRRRLAAPLVGLPTDGGTSPDRPEAATGARRPGFRFRLRSLVVVVGVAALALAWWQMKERAWYCRSWADRFESRASELDRKAMAYERMNGALRDSAERMRSDPTYTEWSHEPPGFAPSREERLKARERTVAFLREHVRSLRLKAETFRRGAGLYRHVARYPFLPLPGESEALRRGPDLVDDPTRVLSAPLPALDREAAKSAQPIPRPATTGN